MKRNRTDQGIDLWFHNPDIRPLFWDDVVRLYNTADWRFFYLDDEIVRYITDNDTAITEVAAIVKAFSLQYLMPISTETRLAQEISRNSSLRMLCQFPPDKHLTANAIRSKLQRFKQAHFNLYVILLLRSLISLVLAGKDPNLQLPYVYQLDRQSTNVSPTGPFDVFQLSPYGPEVRLWTTPRSSSQGEEELNVLDTHGQTMADLSRIIKETQEAFKYKLSVRNSYNNALPFPAEVKVSYPDDSVFSFSMLKSPWISEDGKPDTLPSPSLPNSSRMQEYTTCYAVILRQGEKGTEILLSQRKSGYGKMHFTLPGGKRDDGESIEDCIIREVREETGLYILNSQPVSVYNWRMPGKPPVQSIGAFVTEYEGQVQHREKSENTPWKWYFFDNSNIDNLPTPLFFPTRAVLRDYVEGRFAELQWADIEMQPKERCTPENTSLQQLSLL